MPQNPAAALEALVPLTDVVIDRLTKGEAENAHTALTVLLVAALESFGPESVAMKQFFPVLDAIKNASTLQIYDGRSIRPRCSGRN